MISIRALCELTFIVAAGCGWLVLLAQTAIQGTGQ